MAIRWTAEELDAMRLWYEAIDNSPATLEEYELSRFVEELLDPETAKRKEKNRQRVRDRRARMTPEQRAAEAKYFHEYYQNHKKAIARRKAEWYQRNKERIQLQQREYRISTGKQMSPEEKKHRKAKTTARRKTRRQPILNASA